jgi:hypothetical protein
VSYICDYFFTPVIREVHIDIRHICAFWIEETFKRELVA